MPPKPAPYRLKDGTVRWAVRFRLTPGTNPVKETFTTQAEAQKFVRLLDAVGPTAARQARAASDTADHHTPSLAAWLEHHLTQLAASATPGTIADYRRLAARTWLPTLGPLPLDAITRQAVTTWITTQRGTETRQSTKARADATTAGTTPPPVRTYSPKSIQNAQRLLSTVLQAAVEADLITRNVARGVPLPKDTLSEEMTFLTHAEFATLLDHIPPYWQPLVLTLAGTGMRWGEATALTVADVDPHQGMIRVVRAWKKGAAGVYLGTPKSARSRRTIAMGGVVAAAVLPLLPGRDGTELVFTAKGGGRVRAQNFHDRVWRPAVTAADLGKRPRVHDLRHSHASWLLGKGVPAQVVQHRLGHESLETTSRVYAHLLPDAQVAAALATDAALAMSVPQIEA